MKTRLLATFLATMAGCGSKPPAATTSPAPAHEAEATPATSPPADPAASAAVTPSAKPEIGAWGFDLTGMDTHVPPGQSFYRYANGQWLASTQIPADKAVYAMFTMLTDRSDERTRQIIESASGAPGSDGQRIADYYQTFMDEAAVEAKGKAPIQPDLDRIAQIKDIQGVVLEFAAMTRWPAGRGMPGQAPFRMFVNQDAREPANR